MEVTEVRLTPASGGRGFVMGVSLLIDGCLAVHDVKVIDKGEGPFVSMPSKKQAEPCPACRYKNAVTAKFCSECGAKLPEGRLPPPDPRTGKVRIYYDLVHPVTRDCRKWLVSPVLDAYEAWLAGDEVLDKDGLPFRRSTTT